MNQLLDARFDEKVHRLALGLEPIDACRGTRIPHPIAVGFDGAIRDLPGPRVERHESCLHALRYQPSLKDRIGLRFEERLRHYVQRRISYPIMTLAQAETLPYQNRVRRPLLYPGAAYDAPSRATGVRGLVTRNNVLVRWARAVATIPDTDIVVGRAHGDDRGEFFLLIDPSAAPPGELADPISIRVDVFARAAPPVPVPLDLPSRDPLWDLPVEEAQALDPGNPAQDDVSLGSVIPAGYTATAGRVFDIPLGTVLSGSTEFKLP